MNQKIETRVCPVEHAGFLDISLRKLVQNPEKILAPHVFQGMTALDLGCGPGFFTLPLAKLVGPTGSVVGADIQDGMLFKLENKLQKHNLSDRITTYNCREGVDKVSVKFDFILLFYMFHEIPDKQETLESLTRTMKKDGKLLFVEPDFHVSRDDFDRSIELFEENGLKVVSKPKIFFSKSALLELV